MPSRTRGLNFLEFVPERLVESLPEEEGRFTLLVPKFRRRLWRNFLKYMKYPNFKIHLDEVGSFLWERCDGRRTVGELSAGLRERFAERVEPAEERTSVFFRRLKDAHAVRLNPPAAPATEE